jgi:hypothetical protein
MGRATIILIIGLSVITSFLILSLNANSKEGLRTTVDHYENTQARLIANSGIEVYLEILRRNKTMTGGKFNGIDLMNGYYNMDIYGSDSNLTIKSISYFGSTSHETIVNARRRPMKMPNLNSALYISADNTKLNLNGNVDIDGNDHKINGTPGSEPPVPGIGVDSPSDSAFIIKEIKPKVSKAIEGLGGPPSVYTVLDTTDWMSLTEDFIFSADTVLSTGTYSNGSTFGTYDKPIITFANGNVDFTDATGYGVMIVNGNLNLSGNFKYYGMVIVYGQSTIVCQTIGNNGIYGGTILVGEEVSISSLGNSYFHYSSEAINLSKLKLKSSRFEVLSWWE